MLDGNYSAAVINLGCKVNKYESDSMKHKLSSAGYIIVDPEDVADFYIVNTCSVTNIAERKSRQMLRRAKRRNPSSVVVAAGCYVNADHKGLEAADYVDILVGNNCKKDIVEILNDHIRKLDLETGHNKGVAKDDSGSSYVDISKEGTYEEMGSLGSSYMDHKRAYIKIQDGCNQFCSYCIIPYTRGRVRSRNKEHILDEAEKLSKEGVKEIVLTGIHISSYGTDFEGASYDIADLVRDIAEIDGVRRIRFGSLEPGIITEHFLDKLKGVSKLCPHFHLSLQSACNGTLKRMNRRYTIEDFFEKCKLLRRYYDRPAITTDIIVGFPGETEEEFNITYNNLERLKLYEIHVFKYSVRKGTAAAAMPDQVKEEVKNQRSDRLIRLTKEQKGEFEKSLKGLEDFVLAEEKAYGNDCIFTGYTTRYVKVDLQSDGDIVNEIIPYTF
ncbi:MAG: tRNA (N(6)-L-threonylcarbamoyladenosine(37)-C(2))-methylthiotransferase MtaB [Lachnospiraceae bacterium]|nr:tRNA (N(6)-L-threonylcarbamoyladenosine(37)-C(2))-methylthiotransferase MtaB [Lachnospiraceae bacterium]